MQRGYNGYWLVKAYNDLMSDFTKLLHIVDWLTYNNITFMCL